MTKNKCNCHEKHIETGIGVYPNGIEFCQLHVAAPELLAFAESIANNSSANLHGFHRREVEAARRAVKAAGGRLDAIGRYKAGEVTPMSFDEYDKVKFARKKALDVKKGN